jgi:hypothetical protein
MLKMPKPTLTFISTFWILLILSPFLSFAAESEAPEITSGPDLFVLTNTEAIINWETDENSDSTIQYDLESRA